MKKIRSIIVEDEEASLYILKDELASFPNVEIIQEYRNGRDGLKGINSLKPDLIFVDIEMPDMNGFMMLQRLEYDPAVIFCTGHKKYALEAWDFDASDFIVKPVNSIRIAKALEKALDDIQHKRLQNRLVQQKLYAGFIELSWITHEGKKTRYFSPDEIHYLKGDRDYLKVYVSPDIARELKLPENLLTIKKTMKWAVSELSKHNFVQIHKSYLVNLGMISEWNRSLKELRLYGLESALPIGRAYINQLQEKWQEAFA